MLTSSTITIAASRGFSALRLKCGPPIGEYSSSRCSVIASAPVASLSRLAARPVGEASRNFSLRCWRAMITVRRLVVFPVPGPPVSTLTLLVSAIRTASCCLAVRSIPRRSARCAKTRGQFASRKNGAIAEGARSKSWTRSATARSARANGSR